MMNYFNELVNPKTKESLELDWENNTIKNLNVNEFYSEIVEKIPIVLPNKIAYNKENDDLLNFEFNYVDHYKEDAKVFDYFKVVDEITENEKIRLNQKIKKIVGNTDHKTILDVGCGNGWVSKSFLKENNQVVSMDIAITNVSKALKNQAKPNHFGMVADVFNLPFKENYFDVIIASEIMEHVIDPNKFMESLYHVLKPGGKLIITTPYNEVIPSYLCVHCNNPTPANAHLHSFNEKNISDIMPKEITNWRMLKSGNKFFMKLRIYQLLKNAPYGVWNFVDKIGNKLLKNETRLLIEINK